MSSGTFVGRMLGAKGTSQNTPQTPAPIPTPILGREEGDAKKKAAKRGGGRASTQFAGNLMSARNDSILKTELG